MNPFRVVICGGGVAAVEALLKLRRLAGDAVDVDLVAPNEHFSYRALSVTQPFGMAAVDRHPLRRVARDTSATLHEDELAWVEVGRRFVHTRAGAVLPYDALLIAVGARMSPAFEHATTFLDAHADELVAGIAADVEAGYTRSVAFLAPPAPSWPLPLYELALLTAERARSMCADDVALTLVTADEEPLAAFGHAASAAARELLDAAGIEARTGAVARVPAARRLVLEPGSVELRPDRIVAMPRLSGPAIRGVPGAGAGGFVPIDGFARVPQTGGRVFAAGDATSLPVKHGGLAAQQADAAATGIAALAGAPVEPQRFRTDLRGMLLTGSRPLYLRARVVGGRGFESSVSHEPSAGVAGKVAADELAAYLAQQPAHA